MSAKNDTHDSRYDLEERLLNYAADIIRFTESMLKTDSGRHISNQLMRSGTAPLGHQGEAVSAESSRDFIHKMKVALKELREADRWLKLVTRVPLVPADVSAKPLLVETDELIRIFVASIKTAQRNVMK